MVIVENKMVLQDACDESKPECFCKCECAREGGQVVWLLGLSEKPLIGARLGDFDAVTKTAHCAPMSAGLD